MRSLSFKAQYIQAILDGTKTTTMRRINSPANPSPGEDIHFRNGRYRPPFAEAKCISVKPLALADITDAMARKDGFSSADELRATLRETYGPYLRRVEVITFQVTRRL